MALRSFEQFSKSIVSLTNLQQDVRYGTMKYNSVLSGMNYGLTYGSPTMPESDATSIRDENGFVYFMVGLDAVGSPAKVIGE